jgi:capsular polysaccharide biosynthesis protein
MAIIEAVGLDLERCRFVDISKSVVTCEQLLAPTYDRFNSEIRPDLIKIHESLRGGANALQPPQRLLFISRMQGSARSLTNRSDVEAAVERMGYEIIRPERLSFAEQVALFSSARVVLGECGSGMHNALFCVPGARIGLLQSATNQNFLQAQIAMMKQQDIFYVIGEPDPEDEGAFSVELQDVRNVAEMMKAP